MKKCVFLLLCLAFNMFTLPGQAPDWRWADQIVGSDWNQAYDVATDGGGNVYVAGFFIDSARFEGMQFYHNWQCAYLAKYDSMGDVQWVRIFPATGACFAEHVVATQTGELILLGRFEGSITVGASTFSTAGIYEDYFLTKLDTAGNVLWAKQSGNVSSVGFTDVEVDDDGFIYLAGDNYLPQSLYGLPATLQGAVILKLDPSGNPYRLIEQKGIGSYSLAVDSSHCIWHTGRLNDTIVVGADTLTPTAWDEYVWNGVGYDTLHYTNQDFSFLRFDSAGTLMLARHSTGREYAYHTFSVASAAGGLYAIGYVKDTTDFWGTSIPGNGVATGFLMHLDSTGAVVWTEAAESIDPFAVLSPKDIIADEAFIYLTGWSRQSVSFAGLTLAGTTANNKSFILKLDHAGNGIRAIFDPSPASREEAHGIAVDADGGMVIAGFFEDSVSFGPHHLYAYTNGFLNMMVAKVSALPLGAAEAERDAESRITVFPNPTLGQVQVWSDEPVLEAVLFDGAGREVQRLDSLGGSRFAFTLERSGLFYLRVTTAKGIAVSKVLRVD
jgi:hypothetical protein